MLIIMRISPLAVAAVAVLMASSSSSSDAFVMPTATTKTSLITSHSRRSSPLYMATANEPPPPPPPPPVRKLSNRALKLKQELETAIQDLEAEKQSTLDELTLSQTKQNQLTKKIEYLEKQSQLKQIQLENLLRGSTGLFSAGGAGGTIVAAAASIATVGGGFVAARSFLQQRQEKIEEEQARLEKERLDKERLQKMEQSKATAKQQLYKSGRVLLVSICLERGGICAHLLSFIADMIILFSHSHSHSHSPSLLQPIIGTGALINAVVTPFLEKEIIIIIITSWLEENHKQDHPPKRLPPNHPTLQKTTFKCRTLKNKLQKHKRKSIKPIKQLRINVRSSRKMKKLYRS